MPVSNKPIVWGLFAGGGTLAAFIVPALILLTSLAVPLGFLPADSLSYDRVLGFLQNPLAKICVFGIIFLVIWHAAHRMRITANDLGFRADKIAMLLFYGLAALGSILAAAALLWLDGSV
jgi:fumarate reductase subunit D